MLLGLGFQLYTTDDEHIFYIEKGTVKFFFEIFRVVNVPPKLGLAITPCKN